MRGAGLGAAERGAAAAALADGFFLTLACATSFHSSGMVPHRFLAESIPVLAPLLVVRRWQKCPWLPSGEPAFFLPARCHDLSVIFRVLF